MEDVHPELLFETDENQLIHLELHGYAAKRVRLATESASADQLDRWMLRVLCAESAGDDTLD